MTRTGTVERAYVDTLSLLDPSVVVRYVACVALLFASLLFTAHWAGSPRAAQAGMTAATVVEAPAATGAGIDLPAGAVR